MGASARYESVIAVGATDELDARYTPSSTGYTLELVTPGVNIYSTAMGGGSTYLNGTSTSSPHVAGVAALLIAAGLTDNVDVRHRLRDSAEDLGTPEWDIQFGKGMVNANLAINFSEPPDQSAPTTTISLSGTMGDLNWYVSDVRVTLSATDDVGGSGVAVTKYSLDGGQIWNTYTSPFDITADGIYDLLARSWDNAGNDEGPPDYEYIQLDQTPPVVTETVIPTQIDRVGKRGTMVDVDYIGTADDATSGIMGTTYSYLIDEYGELSRDLGSAITGTVSVEAWCRSNDKDGRIYTIQLTAVRDRAGNYAPPVEATTLVIK